MNRLEYSIFGQLRNVNEIRCECLLITLILVRVYLFRLILKPWADIPNVKKKEQLQTNCYIVGSIMYEIIMNYMKGKWMKVGANQAHLPIETKTFFRPLGPLLTDRF